MSSTIEGYSLPTIFTTRTAYPLPSQKFMIPASWKRYQLSQLINKALSLAKPIPFDFLIRGEVLRTSLAAWCTERSIGTEETLEVEYFESVMPPQRVAGLPHDDWVSSVSCQVPGHFLTASYDAQIRVFNSSQKLVHSILGHTAPVTSFCLVPPSGSDSDTHIVASASHDTTARLNSFSLSSLTNVDAADQSSTPSSRALASLHLHTAPISSISASSSGSHLLTASWDTYIGLWNTSVPEEDEVPLEQDDRKKRRKLGGVEGEHERPPRKAPVAVLKSHTGRVMKAIFGQDGQRAYSCGLDSTVRTWDVASGVCTNTMTATEKPFLDLILTSDEQTAVTASTDRAVSLYDTRILSDSSTSTVSTSVGTFAHPALPSCLSASPSNPHQIVSGAYDGVVRIWDLRSAKSAIASLQVSDKQGNKGKGGKVLAVDWAKGVIGVGGENGFEIWRVGEEGQAAS